MSSRAAIPNEMLDMYRYLILTRGLEERLERLFKQGHIVGGLYRSLGQEATAVGSALALEEGDWLAPSIRDLGALLVRGVKPEEVFMQYTARAAGPCAGKDNTNHHSSVELGIVGPVSPLGTQLCVLNGVALSFRMRGQDRVCMTYQGEGATRTGASHEGFAFAAARKLPVVVVIEHNRWAFSTRSSAEAAVDDWADVALAYGIPAVSVDGNDVLAVRAAAGEAVAAARAGHGPRILVAETYRMLGHAQHDPQSYVPEAELEAWRERDPITFFETLLSEQGLSVAWTLAALRKQVDAELDAAAEKAIGSPLPAPEDAMTRVYAEPEGDLRPWTRREAAGAGA